MVQVSDTIKYIKINQAFVTAVIYLPSFRTARIRAQRDCGFICSVVSLETWKLVLSWLPYPTKFRVGCSMACSFFAAVGALTLLVVRRRRRRSYSPAKHYVCCSV